MHAVVRALPLAFAFAALLPLCAEEALSPLLAPRVSPPPATRERRRASAAVSDRVRSLINAASFELLAGAKPFEAPGAATGRAAEPPFVGSDATIMEPFVVRSAPLRIIERRLPDPPLLDFLKTGKLYRGESSEVTLRMKILRQPGLGAGREFTRGEIEFMFRW